EFKYGRLLVRARIDTTTGSWPAIWTKGIERNWPENGEVDIMEFYQVENESTILANATWGPWSTTHHKFSKFLQKDPQWPEKFHVWRMDWDENSIKLFLDDELLNEIDFEKENTLNSFGENPFQQPHFLLLNLAVDVRVDPEDIPFP